jgi:hypothetical protein
MTDEEILEAWRVDADKAKPRLAKRDAPGGRSQTCSAIHGANGTRPKVMLPREARDICAVGQVIEDGARACVNLRAGLVRLCKVNGPTADRMINLALKKAMVAVIATKTEPVESKFYGLTDAGRKFLAQNRGKE